VPDPTPSASSRLPGREALSAPRWEAIGAALGLPDSVPPELLSQAFCHASYAREAGLGPSASNQRLEFLGDAILDMVLAEHLFLAHPEVPEGALTKMKAATVRAEALARTARRMALGQYLLLGKGEEETGGRGKSSILADCLEALLGAVYLATDLATVTGFVLSHFASALAEMEAQQHVFDYKTALQELLQQHTKRTPTYTTVGTSGPPHDRTFHVEVHFGDLHIGTGEGPSKQAAQQAAARAALETKGEWLPGVRQGARALE
jgi:ribonuclease III